jgi:hypothetical protein
MLFGERSPKLTEPGFNIEHHQKFNKHHLIYRFNLRKFRGNKSCNIQPLKLEAPKFLMVVDMSKVWEPSIP